MDGWWQGRRLVSDGTHSDVGAALVRAACAHAEARGVLRFEATVQSPGFFKALGLEPVGAALVNNVPHTQVRWPIGRTQALADATKRDLGQLLQGDPSFRGLWLGLQALTGLTIHTVLVSRW